MGFMYLKKNISKKSIVSNAMMKNVLLVCISVSFALVISEIVVRYYVIDSKSDYAPHKHRVLVPERIWTEYHSVLGWYNEKNKTAFLEKDTWRVEINTNSVGFRGTNEYQESKEDRVTRILTLGDSFVFGWGVEDNQTFSAIAGQKEDHLEVLNLGVSGYGMDQIYLSYKEIGKSYDADYVVVGILPEDFWRSTRAFSDAGKAKPFFSLSLDGSLVSHNKPVPREVRFSDNQFPNLESYGVVEELLMKSELYKLSKRMILKIGKIMNLVDPNTSIEWRLGRVILQNLIEEIHTNGATPIFLIIPPDRWILSPRPTSLRRSIIRFAKQEAIHMIDLTPHFIEAVNQSSITDYYIKDDWHWTANGHRLVSDIIVQYLFKNDFITK